MKPYGRPQRKCLLLSLVVVSVLAGCQADKQAVRPVPYARWESASLTSNGIRLHYWRTGGASKPVMIMAHGITDYGLSWSSLAARFEAEYDVIMYDARGHGFSEKPDGPYDLASQVEDMVGLIQALDIDKPILVGHSLGSATAALAAATYPEMPRAVILEDPVLADQLEQLKDVDIPTWKRFIEADKALGKQALMKLARAKRHPGLSDYEYDHWAEAKLLVSPQVVDVLLGEGLGDPVRIYPRIVAPTLILKADADPERRKRYRQTAALLPHGTIVHIDGAGHLVRLDRPAETERQIRAFLAGLKTGTD
ncbi:MAG: alpha/beta hydrolase [Sedimentisphaerales bacterium]|nr:alpha/beta hydrolase [Sedimentisphaerales bacterium]